MFDACCGGREDGEGGPLDGGGVRLHPAPTHAPLSLKWGGVESVDVGTTVWRVEKMRAKLCGEGTTGTFHKGDSYIILDTQWGGDDAWQFHTYYWIGPDSSQDEAGASCALVTELSTVVPGKCHHTRVEGGSEPTPFLDLFPVGGITLKEGGVESGFNHAGEGGGGEGNKQDGVKAEDAEVDADAKAEAANKAIRLHNAASVSLAAAAKDKVAAAAKGGEGEAAEEVPAE